MSDGQEDVAARPIIIVRRKRGGGEEGHHGGVWKIAYADFMTAMMAFFLVMWLVNAADKQTIVQIAAYFNPIRLTDKSASSKGLNDATAHPTPRDAKEKSEGALKVGEVKPAKGASKSEGKSQSQGTADHEAALFEDPDETLEKIAEAGEAIAAKLQKNQDNHAAAEDPFNPATNNGNDMPIVDNEATDATLEPPKSELRGRGPTDNGAGDAAKIEDEKYKETEREKEKEKEAQKEKERETERRQETAQAAARDIERDIREQIAAMGGTVPKLDVKVTPEGILISLTDSEKFGMFAISSAEPQPQLVLLMERVGDILRRRPGKLTVRGHTDGRPFRSPVYDNWRLSSARAHMAHYMLRKAGIKDDRFDRIEGYGDRDLKVPQNKDAAENRRIEILLESPMP